MLNINKDDIPPEWRHIDLTPHYHAPLLDESAYLLPPDVALEGDKVVMLPTRAHYRKLRTPPIHYFDPEQVKVLVMLADEISLNVTHLNIGRETKFKMGHVGAVLKREEKVIAHLDGLPAEKVEQPDGTSVWVPVGMGKKPHRTKLFCMLPITIERRRRLSHDHGVYRGIGSISLADLSYERRREVAERISWSMEAINNADINYIIPGGTSSQEAMHLLLEIADKPVVGPIAKTIVKSAAKAKEIGEDVEQLVTVAGQTTEDVVSFVLSTITGHRFVPDKVAAINGCNSKDILLAVADVLGRRQDVEQILTDFLDRPGMEDFRLPGGNSDLWQATIWLQSPAVRAEIEAEAKARRREQHQQAIAGMSRIAAAGAAVAFIQGGGQAWAMEGLRIVQQRIGDNDPLLAFRHATETAVGAASAAAAAIQDPVRTISKPWSVLTEFPVPGTGLSLAALASLTYIMYGPNRPKMDGESQQSAPAVTG